MGRWEPDARGRLEQAALELYVERGYDNTTVAQIAERAGLTERTFFRHFADKREVLFSGGAILQGLMAEAVAGAPGSASALDAVGLALDAAAAVFEGRLEIVRRRQGVIAANPELQERELIKMSKLAATLADALRQRGVEEPAATLSAEAGIAVFRVAFARWVSGSDGLDMKALVRESLEELKAVTSAG